MVISIMMQADLKCAMAALFCKCLVRYPKEDDITVSRVHSYSSLHSPLT